MTELSIIIEYDEKIDFGVSLANEICKSLNEVEDNKWKIIIDDCFIMIYDKTSPIVFISFNFYKIKFGKKKNVEKDDLLNSYCEYVKDTLKLKNIELNTHIISNYINPELQKIDFANAHFHNDSYNISMKISEARENLFNKRNEMNGNISPGIYEVSLFKDVIDKIKRVYDTESDDYIYGIELIDMIEDDDLCNDSDRGGGDYVKTIRELYGWDWYSVYIGNNKFDDYVIINIFDEKTKHDRNRGKVILLYNRTNDVITFDNYNDGATAYENELIFVHNKNDYFEAYEKHDDFYGGENGLCNNSYEYTRQTYPKVYKMIFHEIDENELSDEIEESSESSESS